MDFDSALDAHVAWKMKLSTYLRKPDGSLKADDILPDNRCVLGKWIYGEGATYSTLAEYKTLQQAHTQFLAAAADVVRRADAHENISDDIAFGSQSAYGKASSTVVLAITSMKAKAKG